MSKLTYLDIETTPNEGYFWRCGYKISIQPNNISRERAMICAAWAHDDGKIEVADDLILWDNGVIDDSLIVKKLAEAVEDSTILVHHNGDKFDIPWINARLRYHGYDTIGPKRSIDTYKVVKSKYNMNSFRLDYVAKYFGVGRKIKSDYQWWVDIMEDNENCDASFAKMVKYNKMDVEVLRDVFKVIEPDITYNWYNIIEDINDPCVGCGHEGPHQHRGVVPNQTTGYERYTCKSCGKWMRGPNKKEHRRRVL